MTPITCPTSARNAAPVLKNRMLLDRRDNNYEEATNSTYKRSFNVSRIKAAGLDIDGAGVNAMMKAAEESIKNNYNY